MEYQFTRKEACELTGLTGKQVDHLCKEEIIVPYKIGSPRRPTVLYSWNQIIELKIVSKLKKINVSTKIIYGFLNIIRQHNHDLSLQNKYIINSLDFEDGTINIQTEGKGYYRKPLHFGDPKSYSIEIEIYKDEYIECFIFPKDILKNWMGDLIDKGVHMGFEVIPPLGDIFSEINDAAKKHKLFDFEKKAGLSSVA